VEEPRKDRMCWFWQESLSASRLWKALAKDLSDAAVKFDFCCSFSRKQQFQIHLHGKLAREALEAVSHLAHQKPSQFVSADPPECKTPAIREMISKQFNIVFVYVVYVHSLLAAALRGRG